MPAAVARAATTARRRAAALLAGLALLAAGCSGGTGRDGPAPAVRLPPAHAGFDYQIGGPYPPPDGAGVISRDRSAGPAAGRYNICCVNAFQVQPGERDRWDGDLLLRDATGALVVDTGWDEPLLDIGSAAKRKRIADRVGRWIDGCARDGFDAVEPDNLDSWTRSHGLLTERDAAAFQALLSERAHSRGMAVGQKNTTELLDSRSRTGVDFAVAEECGAHGECGAYAEAFDDRVVVVEYSEEGLRRACDRWGDRLSIVGRDRNVSAPGDPAYHHATCPASG